MRACVVLTLIGDSETVLPESFPVPWRITDMSSSGRTETDPGAVKGWIEDHLRNPPERSAGLLPLKLRGHEAVKLLDKACRSRQYWLRKGDDVYASRILDNPYWPLIESLLDNNGLLRVEHRQASGSNERFIHIRQAEEILREDSNSGEVVSLFRELVLLLSTQ